MMKNFYVTLCCLPIVALLSVSCQSPTETSRLAIESDLARVFHEADRWTLHALDPSWPEGDTETAGHFHKYEILGSAQLDAADDRAALVEALNDGITRNSGMVAACFNPRHGLHAELPTGEVADLVICFECLQIYMFDESGERVATKLTSEGPTATFNRIYRAAGLKIAE